MNTFFVPRTMIFFLSFWIVFTCWAQAEQGVAMQTSPGSRAAITNITTFFAMLPEECFMGQAPTDEERQSLLSGATVHGMAVAIKDVRNGYLSLVGGFEGVWEMCFWNTKDQGKLLAVNNRQCGPVCSTRLFFYRLDPDENLQPDTSLRLELENQLTSADFYYTERMGERELSILRSPADYIVFNLPRLGRDIVIRRDHNVAVDDGISEHLLRPITDIVFVWDGMKFTKKSP